ncbi:hypothetical protein L218DRAFT_1006063 [Marasmius fiardii PR-910]|nr:hypothetical protein L218DRAFT_1006063 [Marasmius fiardii PR-910]
MVRTDLAWGSFFVLDCNSEEKETDEEDYAGGEDAQDRPLAIYDASDRPAPSISPTFCFALLLFFDINKAVFIAFAAVGGFYAAYKDNT